MKTMPVTARLLGGIAALILGTLIASGSAAAATTGSISGTVVDVSNAAPISGIEVCAVDVASGAEVGCAATDSRGAYTVDALPPGTYWAYFSAFDFGYYTGSNYAAQFYPEKDSWEEASSIVVASGAPTEHIDAELHEGAQITGTVTDASTNDPLGSIEICVHPPTDKQEAEEEGVGWICRWLTTTENDGTYNIGGLPTGEYVVEFSPPGQSYVPQFYDGRYRWDEADLVTATEGGTTSGIDAELAEEEEGMSPVPSTRPVLSGAAMPGATLSCSVGSWLNNPDSYSYGWLRDGLPIVGEVGSTYEVAAADEGHKITCVVTATNAFGSTPEVTNELFIPITTEDTQTLPVAPAIPPATGPVQPPTQPQHRSRDAVVGSVAVAPGSKILVRLSCPGEASCSGVVRLLAEVEGHPERSVKRPRVAKQRRALVIGQSHFSVGGGRQAMIRVRLNGRGRTLVHQAGRRGLKVRLAGTGIKARSLSLRPEMPPRRHRSDQRAGSTRT